MKPDSECEFSPEVRSVLCGSHWSPERRVPIERAKEILGANGFPVHPAAERVLECFEGLSFKGANERWLKFDVADVVKWVDEEDLPYLDALLMSPLCPVAAGEGMFYFVARDGGWACLHEGWTVYFAFDGTEQAFRFALLDAVAGLTPRRPERIPSGY